MQSFGFLCCSCLECFIGIWGIANSALTYLYCLLASENTAFVTSIVQLRMFLDHRNSVGGGRTKKLSRQEFENMFIETFLSYERKSKNIPKTFFSECLNLLQLGAA